MRFSYVPWASAFLRPPFILETYTFWSIIQGGFSVLFHRKSLVLARIWVVSTDESGLARSGWLGVCPAGLMSVPVRLRQDRLPDLEPELPERGFHHPTVA